MLPAFAHGPGMHKQQGPSGTCSNCSFEAGPGGYGADSRTRSNSDLILTPAMRPVSSVVPFITFGLFPVGSKGS